jgi:hypothetical protein
VAVPSASPLLNQHDIVTAAEVSLGLDRFCSPGYNSIKIEL